MCLPYYRQGTMSSDRSPNSKVEKLTEYVDRQLFRDSIDSLRALIARKKALANIDRYSILFIMFERGRIPRKALVALTGKDSNGLQHHLRELLDANLIAEVPIEADEDGRTSYYRITKLGEQEIEADIQNITGRPLSLGWGITKSAPIANVQESSGTEIDVVKVGGVDQPGSDMKPISSAG